MYLTNKFSNGKMDSNRDGRRTRWLEKPSFHYNGKGALTIVENITDYDKPFLTYEEQMDLMESRNFLRDLIYILDPYKTIVMNKNTILKILGLPNNLNDRLKQLLIEKFSDINVKNS